MAFDLKSGNSTPFKMMGSSPLKQAIGGGAGEQLTAWNKYKQATKPFSNTPKEFAKGGKEILKTTTKNLISGGKQVVNTAKNIFGKASKFFGNKALGIIPMMIATSSKADQPTKSQGGGQMDPNWLKK